MEKRPPIVVIMGHIDHGKTTLLAKLRDSGMPDEPGEITQRLSAFKINNPEVVFIDTPGHESFQFMRERGVKGADIAIIIVAADEGPKQQTKEAYRLAKNANIPRIIAINKIDKPHNMEKVKKALKGFIEDEIIVELSAETGQGLPDLLEGISLVSEDLDLKVKTKKVEIEILEGYYDDKKGSSFDLMLKGGELKIGNSLKNFAGKIKAIEDEHGQSLYRAEPGTPVKVYGLKPKDPKKSSKLKKKIQKDKLKVILKAKNEGSLMALKDVIEVMDEAQIISVGVGNIGQKDLIQADEATLVVGFGVKAEPSSQKYSKKHQITVLTDDVIYRLVKAIQSEFDKIKTQSAKEEVKKRVGLGQMEIIATFKNLKDGMLVGAEVTEGRAVLGGKVDVTRKKKKVGSGLIRELQEKNKAMSEVRQGSRAGIYFQGKFRLRIGDKLEIWRLE